MWWLEKGQDLSLRRRCTTTKWPRTRLDGTVCVCVFAWDTLSLASVSMRDVPFKGNGPSWTGEASQSQSAASETTGGSVAATNSPSKSEGDELCSSFCFPPAPVIDLFLSVLSWKSLRELASCNRDPGLSSTTSIDLGMKPRCTCRPPMIWLVRHRTLCTVMCLVFFKSLSLSKRPLSLFGSFKKFSPASDMSLASKPTWTSKARAEDFRQLKANASNIRMLAEW